ncbi:MAG: hypothetical protein IT161_13240 [Bryobacterales bacterium]|nr:hypothetical protein [Bryobacterales bacterium]
MGFLPATALLAAGLLQPQPALENEWARVMRVTATGGLKTPPHDHKMNRVMIYLDPGRQITRAENGESQDVSWKAGDALWSPASGTHTAEVIADKPVTLFEVELKKPGGTSRKVSGELDPVKLDPKHYHVRFENEQVRVLRVKIGPGESAPLHQHSLPRLVVYLTPMDIEVTSAEGKTERVTKAAREISFAGPARHSEKNAGSGAFEVVVVEFKSQ